MYGTHFKPNDSKSHLFKDELGKSLIAKTMGLSNQRIINDPKEKSDVRFIVEIALADHFAQQQTSVQSIMMNSERPNKVSDMTAVISKGGNKYKDILVSVKTTAMFETGIKSGNNAQEMFGGLVGNICLTKNDTPYTIVCNKPVSIEELQDASINYVNKIYQLTGDPTLKRTSNVIQTVHSDLSLDAVQRNIEIQEHLFKLLSDNLLRQQPSFYVINRVRELEVHAEFYLRLEPHINNEIFHNKQNANRFVRQAIIAYNDIIQNIARNIKQKEAWEGTGFGEIAEELFNT